MNTTTESEKNASAPEVPQPKTPAKKAVAKTLPREAKAVSTFTAPTPVAACSSREPPAGSLPRLPLHPTHAILDRRVLPSFDEPLRNCDGSRISA
jgi:hypothetical protein